MREEQKFQVTEDKDICVHDSRSLANLKMFCIREKKNQHTSTHKHRLHPSLYNNYKKQSLISSYGASLAQRTAYLALHSSLFGPDGAVNLLCNY